MSFKSYCWSIGTTSFRVEQLNYKNECQLRYLGELFLNNPSLNWNKELQEKYFDLLVSKNFIKDYPAIKDKDAREKTSGLADLGLVYRKTRKITPVGKMIDDISKSGDFSSNNIFKIPKDSYVYLLQFLKYQIIDKDIAIKPFVTLIYMLVKLDYLTKDEFTYLFPTCMNVGDVLRMTQDILSLRGTFSVDDLLVRKMMFMDNYKSAYNLLMSADIVDEDIMEQIGMNRKSGKYDRPFAKVFNILYSLSVERKKLTQDEKIRRIKSLFDAFSLVNKNQLSTWQNLFKLYKNTKIDEKYVDYFYSLDLCNCDDFRSFKEKFFITWHLRKWKSTLKDYYDLNKRYFNLTDIIKYENGRFKLTEIANYYFSDIIEDLFFKELISKEDYEKYFTNYFDISYIYPECNKTEADIAKIINKKFKKAISPEELDYYLKEKKNQEFVQIIDNKFKSKTLLELLNCFKSRNDKRIKELVTDEATPSTIFEYILGIIWYEVSGRVGNLEEYMNLSLDANYMPKSHAPGGEADLIFKYEKMEKYPKHDLLLEATLSESTGQRQMEWEPVSRHLENHILKTQNKFDYVLFVASQLEERTLKSFRAMKEYEIDVLGENIGLKIIPLDVDLIKKIVEHTITYDTLYVIFDEAYKSALKGVEWYQDCLNEKI